MSVTTAEPGPYKEPKDSGWVVTCQLYPGDTTVVWSHVRPTEVEVSWVDALQVEMEPTYLYPIDSMKPFGSVTVPTPSGAVRAGVMVTPYGGGQAPEDCS